MIHFTDLCPKCSNPVKLKVIGWSPVTDEFGDGGTVYFSVLCSQCAAYTGGVLYYDPIGPIMDESLSVYADVTNDVSSLFKGKGVCYSFDYKDKPYSNPLILELLNSKKNNAPSTVPLLRQIYTCMNQECWDAVGMLCRKIIDIETSALWRIKFPTKDNPYKLNVRVDALFPDGVNHHILHAIRYEGNDAAHDGALLSQNDARMILNFTESLIRNNALSQDSSNQA